LGKNTRLTDERWNHIYFTHPEIDEKYIKRIQKTLTRPDLIVGDRRDKDVFLFHKLYHKTYFGMRFLVVVVKHLNDDCFIITAYLAKKVKIGDIIWKKK